MPSKDLSKYAPKAWGSPEFEFELPSGDVCLLRKVGPLELGEEGLLDKLDFATSTVMNVHAKNAAMSNVERVKRDRARREAKAAGKNDEDIDKASLLELVKDAENSKAFREVMDNMLVLAVVAPEMHLPPKKGDPREDEWFYTDSVPFNDKMAIFNKLMEGVRGVETFREGPEETVGDVAPKPVVQPAAKRASRAPRKRSSS